MQLIFRVCVYWIGDLDDALVQMMAVWKAFGVWELEFESEAVRIFLFETLQMHVCKGFCKDGFVLAKVYQNVGHLTSFLTSEVGIVRVLDCCNLT